MDSDVETYEVWIQRQSLTERLRRVFAPTDAEHALDELERGCDAIERRISERSNVVSKQWTEEGDDTWDDREEATLYQLFGRRLVNLSPAELEGLLSLARAAGVTRYEKIRARFQRNLEAGSQV